MPDRFGFEPAEQAEWRELLAAVRAAVEQDLTPLQRHVFVARVVTGIPLDALVADFGTSRGAVYKTLFDARRKLRAALVARGFLDNAAERPMKGRSELDRFLRTDPSDVGCDHAMDMLHLYVDLVAQDVAVDQRYPGIVAHLGACGPCSDDFHALLATVNDVDGGSA
jgi:hypothetical protein